MGLSPRLLGPVGAVQGAVLDGFAEVAGLDIFVGVEVGDGAGDFEDAVVGAGGKTEAGDGVLEQFFAVGVDGTIFSDHFGEHLRVGIDFLVGAVAFGLAVAGGYDA